MTDFKLPGIEFTRQLHEICMTTALSQEQAMQATGVWQRIQDAEHALESANWKLAQIRDATTWAEKPAVIVAAISNILEKTEATA